MFGAVIGFSFLFFILAYLALRFVMFHAKPGQAKVVKKSRPPPISDETRLATSRETKYRSFLVWKHLQYSVGNRKHPEKVLITEQYGYVRPGMLLALMGASGAGKSTLLDVLALRKTGGKTEGEILLNGSEIDPKKYHRYIAYVEQVDIHYPNHTVLESLQFAARSRLSRHTSKEERDQ